MSRGQEELLADVAVGGAKTFTVPNDLRYEILMGAVVFTTAAGGGDRQFTVSILDASDVEIFALPAGDVHGAGTVGSYLLQQGDMRETTWIATTLIVPLPKNMILQSGWKLKLHDANSINLAADTVAARILVRKHPA